MSRWVVLGWLFGCPGPEAPDGVAPPQQDLECADPEPLTAPLSDLCWEAPSAPCGGDPSGRWEATSVCDDGDAVGLPTVTTTLNDYACAGDQLVTTTAYTDVLDLDVVGTFTWEVAATTSETWVVPDACVDELGFADCAAVADAYGFPCEATAGGCECALLPTSSRQFTGGRWEPCGASLVLVILDGTATTTVGTATQTFPVVPDQGLVLEHCVDGDVLQTWSITNDRTVGYRRTGEAE